MSPCSRSWSVSSAGGCAGPPRRTTSRPGPSPSRSRSTSRAAAGAPGALGLRQALARVRHHALPRPAPPLTAVSTPWLAAPSARSRDGGTAEQGPPRTIHPDAIAAARRTAQPRSAVARHALLWNQAAPADKSAAGTACRADSSRVRPCRDPAKLPRPSPRLSRAGVTSLLPDSVAARETEELAAGQIRHHHRDSGRFLWHRAPLRPRRATPPVVPARRPWSSSPPELPRAPPPAHGARPLRRAPGRGHPPRGGLAPCAA